MNEGLLPPVSRGIGMGSRTFLFCGSHLLVRKEGVRLVPADAHEAVKLGLRERSRCSLESFTDVKGVAVAIEPSPSLAPPYELHPLRSLLTVFDEKLASEAGTAYHILVWDSRTRFCGACGARTSPKTGTHGRECNQCGHIFFPRLSPAAIMAVLRDNQILLAHNRRFPEGVYSLVAGFVEPGESLEDCVRREVREETGLRINRISYFGSQPWPFPDALMIGFTAHYHSGNIVADGDEIEDARWFTADSLPRIPGKGSISRRIIDWFVDTYG